MLGWWWLSCFFIHDFHCFLSLYIVHKYATDMHCLCRRGYQSGKACSIARSMSHLSNNLSLVDSIQCPRKFKHRSWTVSTRSTSLKWLVGTNLNDLVFSFTVAARCLCLFVGFYLLVMIFIFGFVWFTADDSITGSTRQCQRLDSNWG